MKTNKSKFYTKKKVTLEDIKHTILFWKGRSKGLIHTKDLKWSDIKKIFFPQDFYEKYSYLGSIPWREEGDYFKALYPLVLAMDYEAKPKWCPRWFLRFLHVFGRDSSIVRVRNWYWHNLSQKLTKGILMLDYKTKWNEYDLRISILAPKHLQDLADDIEHGFYTRGREEELIAEIKKYNPNENPVRGNIETLKKILEKYERKRSN
jgi:hypothetical protein